MNNPKLHVPAPGRRMADADIGPTNTPASQTIGDQIFRLVAEAEAANKSLTVWDLRRLLDLPLPQVFVSLRSLEFERLVSRGNPSQDPLSTPLKLTAKGREIYFG